MKSAFARRYLCVLVVLGVVLGLGEGRWSEQQAAEWYGRFKWSAGVNYTPAYADNQIQFWEKLDLGAIDRQLKWARELGFSKLRVFFHLAPYLRNSTEYLKNISQFVLLAKSRGHHLIPVLFDDCWKGHWQDGQQPEPIPGIHNSQWVQCPGDIPVPQNQLQSYVTDIITTFKNSDGIAFWDLYNEVGNSGRTTKTLPLLKKVFQWARAANPSQPLSSGWWNGGSAFRQINQFILSQSDVITFHAYCDVDCTLNTLKQFTNQHRPIICTQYMARVMKSKFTTHLPVFKNMNVWAINWGFVFGRTQTYYPWGSKQGDPVPSIWFHDVLKPDGTPFDPLQAECIKNTTSSP